MSSRLTRSERRAQTRERLLEAAGRLFARRGYHAVSVDEIAEEAGLTKGAVYSNFESKEDLFLTLFEEHLERRMADIRRAVDPARSVEQQAEDAARDFLRFLRTEPEWFLLSIEFWAYAVRDPGLRPRFAERWSTVKHAAAEMIAERARDLGIALPLPVDHIATAANAISLGLAIEKLADPAAVPDELYLLMLTAFFGGLFGSPIGQVGLRTHQA